MGDEQLERVPGNLQADSAQYPMNLPKIMEVKFTSVNYVLYHAWRGIEDILDEGGDEAIAIGEALGIRLPSMPLNPYSVGE